MSLRRWKTSLVAAGLVAAVLLTSFSSTANAAPTAAPALPGHLNAPANRLAPSALNAVTLPDAQVTITTVTPLVTASTDLIVVVGTVTNTGDIPLNGEINLRRADLPFASLADLKDWADAGVEDYAAWTFLADTTTLADPLPPQQTRSFSFSFTADEFGFDRTDNFDWGPLGILVDVDTVNGSVAVDRTYLIYAPPANLRQHLALTVALPLTARSGESLDQARRRVTDQAQASATLPVDWLLDPRLLQPSQPSQPITDPLTALVADQATKRCIIGLPWGDTDVTALAQTIPSPTNLFDLARQLSTTALHQALSPTAAALIRDDVVWPDGPVNAALVDFAATAIEDPHLIGDLSPRPWQTAAPQLQPSPNGSSAGQTVPPVVQLAGSRATVATIRPDADLTARLLAPTPAGSSQSQELQIMMAELAWQTGHSLSSEASVIVLDRQTEVDSDLFFSRLRQILSLPWVTPTGLASLLNRSGGPKLNALSATGTERGPAPKTISQLNLAWPRLNAFAQIMADPNALADQFGPAFVEPLTLLMSNPQARQTAANTLLAQIDQVLGQVHVARNGSVNMISEAGELPVVVTNDLTEPVRLVVSLRPASRSLVAGKSVSLELEAGSEATARLPVRALANGTVNVAVVLANADGVELVRSTSFRVRVHAEWETVGTAIVGGAFGLVFAFGLVRSIVRRRVRPRGSRP